MSLSFRVVRSTDLLRCQALLAPLVPNVYPPEVWEALPSLWTRLLSERRIEIHVFEDSSRPLEQRTFGLASGVLVAPAFADRLRSDPQSFLAETIYRRELEGRSLILTPDEVAAANSGAGVDAIGLDYVVERLRWTDLAGFRLLPLIPESLRLWLGGYRVRSLHRELFERETQLMARAAGLRRRKPARGGTNAHERARTGRLRPALVGMTLDEALASPGTAASLHFVHAEPIFRFTPAHQELLRLALQGESDADVAEAMGISQSTVKKHWQAVFERVAAVGPDWFPQDPAGHTPEGSRGIEKRRPLLAYLRQHLEEIRPRV